MFDLTETVTAYRRTAQIQAKYDSSMEKGKWTPLTKKLFAADGSCLEREICFFNRVTLGMLTTL